MPTTKKRINITLPDEMEDAINKLALRDAVPTATKAVELIHLALEIEEDDFLNEIAEKRMQKKKMKYYSHKEAWS